jgi:hypothetical protein
VSVGLIVAVIVAIAVVLALVIDTDDKQAVTTNVNDMPMSYYVPESGDGVLGGHDQAVVPAPRAHTGESQGDGLINGADDLYSYTEEAQRPGDLSVTRPTTRHQPFGGDVGFIDGSDSAAALAQAQRAHDEMLFTEWNDPLGWQAIPDQEQTAVVPYEQWLYLEQNGVFETNRDLAVIPASEVDPYERMKFIEQNTVLPGWTDHTAKSNREGFSEN